MKIWRIGYIEDGQTHYTQPIDDPLVLVEVYKSFDDFAIATGSDIWVETIIGNWERVG